MKIYTVTPHFYSSVKGLFPEHDVSVLPENWSEIRADLIVFTGGEDVNPKIYGSSEHPGWEENPRDHIELEILRAIRRDRLITSKVLGICRGIQLLNVGFGGTLVYDIERRFGRAHEYVHDLLWNYKTAFYGTLGVVNSLHHQCIETYGDSLPIKLLATEPRTGSPEVVLWGDKYLGVQFHPELFGIRNPDREKFAEIILNWAGRKIDLVSGKPISTVQSATSTVKKVKATYPWNESKPPSFNWEEES